MTARLAFLYLPRCKPRPLVSLGLFVFFTSLTAWLRLDVFGEQTITLTYGLPLLVCLWYPDLRLLWGMTATFTALSAWKTFVQPPPLDGDSSELMWTMQLINTGFIAVAVHLIVNFVAQLAAQKARLEETNLELIAREEEISRQTEELQTQTEELAQQNEEIQQQSEEVQQQSEELQAQTEELQNLTLALGKRQHLLTALLSALPGEHSVPELPERVCQSLLTLFRNAAGSAILEKNGDQLSILAHGGLGPLERDRWPFERSFAAVVMEHDRTAFVADLLARPDLILPRAQDRELLSVLAAPPPTERAAHRMRGGLFRDAPRVDGRGVSPHRVGRRPVFPDRRGAPAALGAPTGQRRSRPHGARTHRRTPGDGQRAGALFLHHHPRSPRPAPRHARVFRDVGGGV